MVPVHWWLDLEIWLASGSVSWQNFSRRWHLEFYNPLCLVLCILCPWPVDLAVVQCWFCCSFFIISWISQLLPQARLCRKTKWKVDFKGTNLRSDPEFSWFVSSLANGFKYLGSVCSYGFYLSEDSGRLLTDAVVSGVSEQNQAAQRHRALILCGQVSDIGGHCLHSHCYCLSHCVSALVCVHVICVCVSPYLCAYTLCVCVCVSPCLHCFVCLLILS